MKQFAITWKITTVNGIKVQRTYVSTSATCTETMLKGIMDEFGVEVEYATQIKCKKVNM